MDKDKKASMETSRKMVLSALAVLFISYFFMYEAKGKTTTTMDLTRNLTTGGLPYGGGNGWDYHGLWAAVIMIALAWLFYSQQRSIIFYIVALLLFIGLGLGTGGFGTILGFISIAMAGYGIFLRARENKLKQSS